MTAMTSKIINGPKAAKAFVNFVNSSPTPFHAVQTAASLLDEAGFKRVEEGANWEKDLKAGSKFYYTRLARYICDVRGPNRLISTLSPQKSICAARLYDPV